MEGLAQNLALRTTISWRFFDSQQFRSGGGESFLAVLSYCHDVTGPPNDNFGITLWLCHWHRSALSRSGGLDTCVVGPTVRHVDAWNNRFPPRPYISTGLWVLSSEHEHGQRLLSTTTSTTRWRGATSDRIAPTVTAILNASQRFLSSLPHTPVNE